ncbi:MAG: hypothetical protein ACXW5U_32350 [Thermoanaerobaculia bacterium]
MSTFDRVSRVIRDSVIGTHNISLLSANTHLVDDLGFEWENYNVLAHHFALEFGIALTLAQLENVARVRDLVRLAGKGARS